MRICEVIGMVTLSRWHPTLSGACYRVVVPLALADLLDERNQDTEELVAYDDLGAGVGSRIALSEGGEAAQPFEPEMKPIDAYCAAILDRIDVQNNL